MKKKSLWFPDAGCPPIRWTCPQREQCRSFECTIDPTALSVLRHKHAYRFYCASELNLRIKIKPRKRLKRDVPDAMAKPEGTYNN